MPWARIDDEFDEHAKVEALLDEEDSLYALAAIGLWTLALARAHREMQTARRRRNKRPGVVQVSNIRRYAAKEIRAEVAGLLVKYGLWETDEEGWVIHDFSDYLPTPKTIEERKKAGKKGAEARWGKDRDHGKVPPNDGNLPSDDGKVPSDAWQSMARASGKIFPEPEEEQKIKPSCSSAPPMSESDDGALPGLGAPPSATPRRRGPAVKTDDPEFVRFWQAYPRRQGKGLARKAFAKVVKSGIDPEVLITAAQRYADSRRNEEMQFTAYPATWLNGERWDDEAPPDPRPVNPNYHWSN